MVRMLRREARMREESEGTEEVVQGHHDGGVKARHGPKVDVARTGEIGAPVKKDKDREEIGRGSLGRPNVDVQAVFAAREVECGKTDLRTVRSIGIRQSLAGPRVGRLGSDPAQGAHRWLGVGDALEAVHAVRQDSPDGSALDVNNRGIARARARVARGVRTTATSG